jgi:hypothetical protein
MAQYLNYFIPSFTSLQTKILITLSMFSGFYLLLATRSPIKALWPITITLSLLIGHYMTMHYKLCYTALSW